MDETVFHRLADETLDTILARLESADASGQLEVEEQGGVMTISLPGGRQYILNKHAPTRQLWLSSPVSGGLHFSHQGTWALPDGRTLESVLSQELKVPL